MADAPRESERPSRDAAAAPADDELGPPVPSQAPSSASSTIQQVVTTATTEGVHLVVGAVFGALAAWSRRQWSRVRTLRSTPRVLDARGEPLSPRDGSETYACPRCGSENERGARRCRACAEPL